MSLLTTKRRTHICLSPVLSASGWGRSGRPPTLVGSVLPWSLRCCWGQVNLLTFSIQSSPFSGLHGKAHVQLMAAQDRTWTTAVRCAEMTIVAYAWVYFATKKHTTASNFVLCGVPMRTCLFGVPTARGISLRSRRNSPHAKFCYFT